MKFPKALGEALTKVDDGNWRHRLDEMHSHYGTWDKTAHALGVHRRTLEKWRKGHVVKGVRRYTKPASIIPQVRAALGKDRKAAVAGVDWKAMRVGGVLALKAYPEEARTEHMAVGQYMSRDAMAGLAAAYVSGNASRVQRSFDHFMATEYVAGLDPLPLTDVDYLEFG